MPFMLYRVTDGPSSRSYNLVRTPIQISGTRGPLFQIQRKLNPAAEVPFKWRATAADIISTLPDKVPPAQELAIVIDLRPSSAQVSLYRLLDIWGFSVEKWTIIALLLECLFVDWETPNPLEFKRAFEVDNAKRTRVGEFLYLQGGVNGRKWTWGQVGRVNGALLWPDVFEYLATELGKGLNDPS